MPAVGSGQLRHKIQLQSQQQTQDSQTGEITVAWVTYAEVWADVVPMSAREFIQSDSKQSEVRGRIVIRYRSDVDASHRAVHRGKYYNLLGVMPDEESGKEHLTLMTAEGVNLGE
jgi:SPP1 family predicted phage head-tail adaptor